MRAERQALVLRVKELGGHAGHAARRMRAHQRREGGFRVVAPQQRLDFNGVGGFVKACAGRGHLQPPHHIAANHGQQGGGACADMGPELFLQHLQQIALGQIHTQDRVQRVVPLVRVRSHRHGQRHKIIGGDTGVIRQHALEIAYLLEHRHRAAKDIHG